MAIAPAFLINSSGVQHLAILQRELRYVALATIEVASEGVAAIVAISMALGGLGYWAVVATVIAVPTCITIGAWLTSGWRPGKPRLISDVSSMLRFGGTITLNGLVVYAAYNLQKILLGRNFGSDAVGLYGRANELVEMPARIINNAIGLVAFSSLARLQSEPEIFKRYFLKGYSLVISLTIPLTIACGIFANDIVLVVLGPKWTGAVTILQFLVPTILVFGIINPLSWLLMRSGTAGAKPKIALALGPLVLVSYVIGLPMGQVALPLLLHRAGFVAGAACVVVAARNDYFAAGSFGCRKPPTSCGCRRSGRGSGRAEFCRAGDHVGHTAACGRRKRDAGGLCPLAAVRVEGEHSLFRSPPGN